MVQPWLPVEDGSVEMFRRLWALFHGSIPTRTLDPSAAERLLTGPIYGAEVLDHLWSYYSSSKDERAVRRIASVLDWEDLTRLRLQAWLGTTSPAVWTEEPFRAYRSLLLRCAIPIDYENRSIEGPVDLDLHIALLARSGELKFEQLPVALAPQELIGAAMKSAALWSLRSFAERDPLVARICKEESQKPGGAARQHLATAGPPP
jgi:hypothetical protein